MYTVHIHGVPVTAETAEEAAALALRVASTIGTKPARTSGNGSSRRMARVELRDVAEETSEDDGARLPASRSVVEFLRLLSEAGPLGVSSDSLVEKLGLSSGHALGLSVGQLNKMAREVGFKSSQIYATVRRSKKDGGKLWKRRSKLEAAMEAIEALQARAAAASAAK